MKAATKLLGRDAALREVERALESDAAVVTIVGPPGVGKSALGRAVLDQSGVVSCDLSTARDAATFLRKLAQATRVETDGDTQAAIIAALMVGERFVFLDGFDALVGSCRELLGGLVDALPAARWLITSRERTGVEGEAVVALGPLALHAALELIQVETADAEERSALVDLVGRLDCNPLAIQLASARLRTFTAHDLLQRLDQRFALLRSQRDALSLADAIGLSWELLNSAERQALAQCTTFPGPFDIDAAEQVVQLDDDAWVMDVVESLVEKSLLVRLAGGRLDLYESIRAFVEKEDACDLPAAQGRHARYYVALGESWDGGWTSEQLDAAVLHEPHLRAVIERFEQCEPELAEAAAVWNKLLRHRGTAAVHFEVLDRGVSAARGAHDGTLLAVLLQARAELGVVSGQLLRAGEDAQESAEVAAANGLPRVRLLAEVQRAEAERRTGYAREALARIDALLEAESDLSPELLRYAEAHRAACLVEVGQLDAARKVAMHVPAAPANADAADEYQALKRLAYAHYYLGNYEEQLRLNEDALALAKRVGDRRRTARARQGLGDAAFARSDFEAARAAYLEALVEHRELGNEHLCGVLLGNLGAAEHRIDETDAAAKHYVEALAIHRRSGARPYEAVVEFALGALEHGQGHHDDASFHYAHAEELFTDLGQLEDVLATRVCSAWLHIARDDHPAALAALQPGDVGESWSAVFERTRALIDPRAEWEERDPVGSELSARLARTLGAHLRGEVLDDDLRGTLQGRLLLNLLSGETAIAVTSSKPALVVGDGAEWFQTSSGDTVNLRRRKAHRRILEELVVRHVERPVVALDVYDAYDLGWPGEDIEPEAAAERVYWVVGVLRRLGLDQLLLTSDEGYYLDPAADVRRG